MGISSEGIGNDVHSPSDKKYRVTASPSLKVREGPGQSYAKIGNVRLNEIVEKLDENEDGVWFKIRNLNGTLTGWCFAKYLQKESPPSTRKTTYPARGVTRIVGELHGTSFYLTICNPADVSIEVVHEDNIPSAIVRRTGAKFGFNGDDWDRNIRKVKGTEICNGKVYQRRTQSEPSLIVTKDGKIYIDHKNVLGQWNVTSGLRYLVKDGVNLIPPNSMLSKHTERHARSIRGLHTDGRVMFLTIDGDYIYTGMTLLEAATLMLEFGCAVAFDGGGGGDAVDVMDGAVASVPDDEGPDGSPSERKVPQTILVFTKESI